MNKEQQIEETAKCNLCYERFGKCPCKDKRYCSNYKIAVNLYDSGYCKVFNGEVILTPEARDEEMKEINNTLAERDKLKEEIERLKAKNEKHLNAIEDFAAKHCCMKCDIAKILVKEFADKLKEKLFAIFGETMCSDFNTEDITDIIDELLKEYEECDK